MYHKYIFVSLHLIHHCQSCHQSDCSVIDLCSPTLFNHISWHLFTSTLILFTAYQQSLLLHQICSYHLSLLLFIEITLHPTLCNQYINKVCLNPQVCSLVTSCHSFKNRNRTRNRSRVNSESVMNRS